MQLSIPDFDLRHIYESGQCFRWEPLGQDTYRIPAFGRTLTVRQTDGVFDFSCGAGEFDALWRSYFDLDTDYAAIKARVAPRDAYLQAAVAYGWGMRILRQDLWEVIVSFIVSQNNNIPRIRKNLRDLCAMQGGAFPTPVALAAAQPETLRALGLGYRAEYLCAAGAHFTQADALDALRAMSYPEAHTALRAVKGVGPKVADCICLFGLALPLSAQKLDAQDILDRTATAFRQAGGIQADFTVQTYAKSILQGSSTGVIRLKGEKFLLDADGVKTWFDGRTQWSYLTNSDEVNISEPTPEELQSINPYALLSIYKQGYHMKLGKADTYGGKPAYEVILTASNRKQDLQCVIIYVTKDTLQPLCISMTQKGGNSVAIRITSYKTGESYNDNLFTFDKKVYPTAEVIDLR